jgi:hypothetical protein
MKLIKLDKQNHFSGPFTGYCSPWSIDGDAAMKQGVHYQDWLKVTTDLFPAATEIGWSWPESLNHATGVRGYNHIAYGNYDYTAPPTPVEPRQVSALKELRQSFSWEPVPGDSRYNVLTEFYLTKVKGDAGTKCMEVGFFPHYPVETLAFMKKDTQMGQWTDSEGRIWTVSYHPGPASKGPYVTFYPAGDLYDESIDMKAALAFLKAKGVITGAEWVNGLAFGVEPLSGSGQILLNSWNPVLA